MPATLVRMANSKTQTTYMPGNMMLLAPDSGLASAGEHQFTSAFEYSAIGMALIAPDSRRLRVNRAFCNMLGYTEQEMLARTVHDIVHPDDVGEDLLQRARLLAGDANFYQREKRYIHKDGSILWGQFTCSVVRDGMGKPLHFISQVQDITERKAAEQALRESEERFRSLTLLTSDWYWEQDAQLRFTSFSGDGHASDWRPDQQAAIGKCRWELAGLQPLSMSWEQHRQVLLARQPFRDFEYMRVSGQEPPRYVLANGEPVFAADGTFKGYRGTARDITAGKLAGQRLHDTQALLSIAAQIGRLGAWAYDMDTRQLTWSAEVCAIYEVAPGFRPTTRQAVGFCAEQDRDRVLATLQACARGGSPFDLEAQVVTARGRRIWVRLICEAEWDAQGRVRRLLGAVQDITESKRVAEDALQLAEQLTMTLESLTDAFVTVDREWRFTYVNGQAEQRLGRQRGELLGRVVWLELPELLNSIFHHQCERALAEGVSVQFESLYEPAGIWLQVRAYPSVQGLAVYVRDVTERVLAQREILRLNTELEDRVALRTAELKAANKDLEAFSYSIAHDLRAPLGSIDGFSRMLELSAPESLGQTSRHYLTRIRAGVRQMAELTDGLLALSSLSRTSLRHESVDLAAIAREVLAACAEGEPQRQARFSVQEPLVAHGDPRLLRQVIGNLVGNAWKFSARTACTEISVGALTGPHGACTYFVRDNGVGFDPAYASRMFEAFQRIHLTTEFEGNGIGLAIVHKIIARHGGRIWAQSTPQQGATFYFVLGEGSRPAQEPSDL